MNDKEFDKWFETRNKHIKGYDVEDIAKSWANAGYTAGYKQLATEINIILEEEPIVYNFIGRIIPKIKEILADTELKNLK